MLVIYNICSLFTKLFNNTVVEIPKNAHNIPIDIMKFVITTTYFTHKDRYSKLLQGASTGSITSPAVANIYMNRIKKVAVEVFQLKPAYWLRYVDDVFFIWPYDKEKL